MYVYFKPDALPNGETIGVEINDVCMLCVCVYVCLWVSLCAYVIKPDYGTNAGFHYIYTYRHTTRLVCLSLRANMHTYTHMHTNTTIDKKDTKARRPIDLYENEP